MSSSFKDSFAAARKAGKKEFTWNGKSYNTELKETVRPKARGSATGKADSAGPMPRPKAKSVSADAGKGPSGATKSDWQQLKSNIESDRRAREASRKERKAARAAKASTPSTPSTNKNPASKAAVMKAYGRR